MSNLKAYAVGDSDVYAAHTAEQAVSLANDMHGIEHDPAFSIDDVIVLSDADLDKEYPEFDEEELATGRMTTIRHWLNEMRDPGWLCGSGW